MNDVGNGKGESGLAKNKVLGGALFSVSVSENRSNVNETNIKQLLK